MKARALERPHTALPLRHDVPDSHLTSCLGQIDRLRSNAAKDAAAMRAMGVIVGAKALRLVVNGKCVSYR